MPPSNPSPILSGNQMPPPASPPPKSSIGPLAGAIIVILLLVAGGLYFWGAQLNQIESNPPPYIPSNDTGAANENVTSDTSAGLPPQANSDEISSIEADARAMNLDQLNAENNAELNGI